jgi:RND family efflux transporter MFP subunit
MKRFFYLILVPIMSLSVFGQEEKVPPVEHPLPAPQARAVIESLDRTILSSEIGGKVVLLSKSNGDSFQRDEVLLKIECDAYESQRDKTEAKRDLAKIKLEKNLQLEKYNSVGKFDVEVAKLELKEQELELKLAQLNVKRCEIKAPYAGRVVQKAVNTYQNVKPQEQLLEIVNSNALEVKTVVPATWLQWIRVGQKAKMDIDELDKSVTVEIIQIDSVVDPNSQTVMLRAKIDQPIENIIAGMSGTVYFTFY